MADKPTMPLRLAEIFGLALGGVLAYLLTSNLPGVVPAFACAAAIALLTFASTRLTQPVLWWASLGAIAGSVIGAGVVLGASFGGAGLGDRHALRYTVVGTLALAGLVGGIFLGKDVEKESMPKPVEFLKRASGLTVGIFALIVTIRFPADGLDAVRTLSSRLSTMITIFATSLAVPGWIGWLIGKRVGERTRAMLARRGIPVQEMIQGTAAVPPGTEPVP